MRIAFSLATGLLLAGLGFGAGSASAAAAIPPSAPLAGGTIDQVRMHRQGHHPRRHYRRTRQRVMGLVPGPGRTGLRAPARRR